MVTVNDCGDSGRGSRREVIGFVETDVNLYMQDVAMCPVCPQLKPIIASGCLMTIVE